MCSVIPKALIGAEVFPLIRDSPILSTLLPYASCIEQVLFSDVLSCGLQLTGNTVGELIAVTDMHQRKAEMFRQADAFIALPGTPHFMWKKRFPWVELKTDILWILAGGYGTLEELVEVITWNQLGIHKKPVRIGTRPDVEYVESVVRCTYRLYHFDSQVGLLNVDGFYDTLLTFFDKQLEEEFFDNSARSIVVSAPTASELLDKLESYSTLASSLPKLCWEVERPCALNYTTSPIAGLGQ